MKKIDFVWWYMYSIGAKKEGVLTEADAIISYGM